MIQKIYDPIGFCRPMTVKLLIQTLWEKKIERDDRLDTEALHTFGVVLQHAYLLREVTVDRCLGGTQSFLAFIF